MSRKKGAKSQQAASNPGAPPVRSAWSRRHVVFASVFSILIALIIGECLAWFAFRKNIEDLKFSESDLYYYYDRAGHRHNLPNSVGYERMWNNQGRAEFRINSFGFRGPELSAQKPAGTYRVLFLGDSITLGGRLPEDTTFVSFIREKLSADPSTRYEVINAAVSDAGLLEEEAILKSQGIKVKPDLVVLCWYLNDARPPTGFPEEFVYNNWLIEWFNNHSIVRKSYLAGFIYDAVRKSLVAKHLFQDKRFEWTRPYTSGKWFTDENSFRDVVRLARFDWGDAWNDTSMQFMKEKIRRLRDFCEARGIRFLVVAFPLQAQVDAQYKSSFLDKPQNDLMAFAKKHRIRTMNLLPLLRTRPLGSLFYDYCHYTPEGNAIVARYIYAFLRKSGALKLH